MVLLTVYSPYDLLSVGTLVRYLQEMVGFPIKSAWLSAIKAEWYARWPGLTHVNASKYFPELEEIIKGRMAQSH